MRGGLRSLFCDFAVRCAVPCPAQDIYSVVGGAFSGDHYPNQLFANPGHGNHWLKLHLEGVQSNRAALGARIKVIAKTAEGEREIHRVVTSGASFTDTRGHEHHH
jgi:hypothetical protein